MNNVEQPKTPALKPLKQSPSNPTLPTQPHQPLFTNTLANCLQRELKQKYGYQVSKASLPVLALYFHYFAMIKQVVSSKGPPRSKINHFAKEYSKYHWEEEVSQLLL